MKNDAISVCAAYLKVRNVLDFGPSKITVFDFDEQTVQAVKRFADRERIEHLDAVFYNCLDKFPDMTKYDCFYTNPPWGAYNKGESVARQSGWESRDNQDGFSAVAARG